MHDTDTLQRLFRYKAWANDALLRAMEQFQNGAPAKEIAIRIINHTLVVDRIFAANLKQIEHGFASANDSLATTLEELRGALRTSDQWYIDYVSSLNQRDLADRIDFMFSDGETGRMSREEMLMHVTIHGEYHRGQVGLLMMQNSIAPPAGSGLTTYLHTAEASARRRAGGQAA